MRIAINNKGTNIVGLSRIAAKASFGAVRIFIRFLNTASPNVLQFPVFMETVFCSGFIYYYIFYHTLLWQIFLCDLLIYYSYSESLRPFSSHIRVNGNSYLLL